MFIPATEISEPISAQVAVVGAGPAGMAASLELARQGVDVVLLSGGGLGADHLSQDVSRAESYPDGHADPVRLEARRFGGASWAWGGRCVALDPIDFAPRPELDLPGWPISPEDLTRYEAAAAGFLGIGQPLFDASPIAGHEDLCVQLERWAAEPALATRHHDAFAGDTGPRTYLDLTCTGGDIDQAGRLRTLTVMRPDGTALSVQADTFVLATGGLETARLLLWLFASNGRSAPRWTGRGYMGHLKGQIMNVRAGKNAIEALDYRRAPQCYVRRRLGLDERILRTEHLPNINFWLDNRKMSDASHGSPGLSLAYLALCTPILGGRLMPPSMRDYFTGGAEASLAAHAVNVLRSPFAATQYCLSTWRGRRQSPVRPGRLAPSADGRFPLSFSAEERPVFANGVALGRELDRFAVPRPVITRDLQRDDLEAAIAANVRLAEMLERSGLADVAFDGDHQAQIASIAYTSGDGCHQVGTARMGQDSESAVTDSNGRVFGIENLFVSGSAVFPRSAQANPTYAIVCWSLRLADHLSRRIQ